MSLDGKSASAIQMAAILSQLQSRGFKREDVIACIERECKRRAKEFPEQVKYGRMNARTAREEIALMNIVLELVKYVAEIPSPQTSMF